MVIILITFLLCIFLSFGLLITGKPTNLPPGPTSLPFIGNLLSVGPKPHISLAHLAAIHGPVISLRLGILTTIIISSASAAKEAFLKNDAAAKEAFLKNDAVFCYRNIPDCITAHKHNDFDLVFSPPSPYWKTLRKICNFHVFSAARLDSTASLRRKKLDEMIAYVENGKRNGDGVDIGQLAF